MNHIMVDIETLGTKPGCIVLSIGAVAFDLDTGVIGNHFHQHIDLESNSEYGLVIETDTFLWWLQQQVDIRQSMRAATRIGLKGALESLIYFFTNYNRDVYVWANGPSFDLSILKYAYSKVGLKEPWHYRNERCVRTQISKFPEIVSEVFRNENPHDALSDCYYQIDLVVAAEKKLNQLKNTK